MAAIEMLLQVNPSNLEFPFTPAKTQTLFGKSL